MCASPSKKFKLNLNRKSCPESPSKRMRLADERNKDEDLKAKKGNHFKIACEHVSQKKYFDYRTRFLLVYLPSCVISNTCKHYDRDKESIHCMPYYTEESFMIDIKNNAWYEALEVCRTCLTPTQYLSAVVLKAIVNIILNAHEDDYSEYSVKYIIDNCQQILMQNFSTHPPCLDKDLRDTYISFLISPMQDHHIITKRNKNKLDHENDMGIVKYCMTRLEHELSADSKDEPLIDKTENIPEELKDSIRGYHCQKKNENFESLDRQERIERLLGVLETIVELLQFDLAISQKRYTNVQGRNMRFDKLMECVLRCENRTGPVTDNCRQIMRLFTWMIHLQYPESMVKTIVIWLNTTIQTFYSRELDSNSDYPNTSMYSTSFAIEFYKTLSGIPNNSIIKILQRIEPSFMRHMVGLMHVNKILATDEACIITILINFINECQWESYPMDNSKITFSKNIRVCHPTRKLKETITTLLEKCNIKPPENESTDNGPYGRMAPDTQTNNTEISLNHIIHSLYITLEAYLDAYDMLSVYEQWTNYNKNSVDIESVSSVHNKFSTTKYLIKKYAHIQQSLTTFVNLFRNLKSQDKLPETMNIFENIPFIKLYKDQNV